MTSKKVLVIDDESVLIKMVKSLLEGQGYQVISAVDGVEGLSKALNELPALVILDVMMPIMDGYSFVKEFKKDTVLNKIPVLILTSKAELEELFKMEGINNFMTKPFDTKMFLNKVKELTS